MRVVPGYKSANGDGELGAENGPKPAVPMPTGAGIFSTPTPACSGPGIGNVMCSLPQPDAKQSAAATRALRNMLQLRDD
jgi:hypothetical protein